ncbi:hypothetical protein H4S08_002490 [Coemansia sp. RSA 1365]|nr:hypothetical protein H4S08_002490 [Coemansia sp. RSA 1365]
MEQANKLSRQAAEFEYEQRWGEAAKAHAKAAEAYRDVDIFAFDPVATLTLSSLSNRHMRWAESCSREDERCDNRGAAKVNHGASGPSHERDVEHHDENGIEKAPGILHGRNEGNESEFEDFWQYMQSWLANPTAFTRPMITHNSQNTRNWDAEAAPSSQSIAESFYFVGLDPDQSASMHISAAATPKTHSPLQVLEELNESEEAEEVAASTKQTVPVSDNRIDRAASDSSESALAAENQRLIQLVQHLNERVRTLESAAQENSMLKSSIFNFREEFHRHANAVSLPWAHETVPSPHRDKGTGVMSASTAADVRVRQLEAELEKAHLENSKQKAHVTKYRERWERLKESAKRKRQQQEQLLHDYQNDATS